MTKILNRSALAACVLALTVAAPTALVFSAPVYAQDDTPKTRKTPALRAKVYDQLARAQSLADGGQTQEAIVALNSVHERSDSMNSYEKAMMYNFYGFIYYNDEQIDKAIESFEQVVEQQPIPEKFEQSTLFSLAQLHMMQGNYDKTITFIERWEALNSGAIPAKNYVLKAQAMYQKKDYAKSSEYINQAVALVEAEGEVPDENWYVLQRAVFYELKQPEKVKDVLVKMVKHYNQGKYWIQLAGMYGELGEEKKQLAILETAYQEGYITSAADIFNLAQIYYYHQVPYKGAILMEKAINDGVLDDNLRNLKFLGQSWTLAKENDKAIPVMQQAARLSDDGELDAQLAQLFLNMERWDDAIEAADKALQKGELRNPGMSYLVKGMAFFNKKRYNDALNQLAEAEKHSSSKRMAQQWSRYVESEKISAEQLQASL